MNAHDGHFVNPFELDVRNSPSPLQKMSLGNSQKRPGRGTPPATKRRGVIRQSTTVSDSPSPPRWPRPSGLGIHSTFIQSAEERGDAVETPGRSYHNSKFGEVENRDREDLRKDLLSKYDIKTQLYHLITPPASDGCSSRSSIASDARSEASTAQNLSSPRSNNDNEFYETHGEDLAINNRHLQSPNPESPMNMSMAYPPNLHLPDSPQSNPRSWSEPRTLPDQYSIVTDDISFTPRRIIFHGRLYVESGIAANMSHVERDDSDTIEYSTSSSYVDQMDQPSSPLASNPISYVATEEPIPVMEQETTDGSTCRSTHELIHLGLGISNMENVLFSTEELQEPEPQNTATAQSITDNEEMSVDPINPQTSVDIYLKKGNLGRIEDWTIEIPDSFDAESMDSESQSTSILMTTAEEELEDRVSRALRNDPALAPILISKLKHKLSFILPLFCDEEDRSPFDFSQGYYHNGYERGAPGRSTSSSAPSTSSKSITAASTATPATSADLGDQDDDEVPQRSRKRPRISSSRDPDDHGRRRLRCHFHAKCPITHTQKTCVLSGWLSIHNLRGHYGTHHTRIRCNKCFQEFDRKPPKNQHQRNCRADQPPPPLDVIDCDKTDEIEEVFVSFRTWRLDTEVNEEMKNWIMKYKVEFVRNNVPTDDAHDCRELAKWYHIWRILFPSHQGPVPSPFQNASISPGDLKLERLLEVFQSTVESKVENNEPPPMDLGGQIDYYKDVIRTLFRLFLRVPSPNPGPSSELSVPSDTRSISTPANSSMDVGPSRQNAVPSTPAPNPLEKRSSHELIVSNDSRLQTEDFQLLPSSSSTLGTASAPLSLNSPCAAETRGAVGESPVIMRPQRRPSNKDPKPVSPSQPALAFQPRTPPITQSPAFISVQNGTGLVAHSMANTGNMMPPPMRPRHVTTFVSQSIQQPLTSQQQHHPQQGHPQSFPFPVENLASQFTPNNSMADFAFPDGQQNRGNQSWDGVQMGLAQNYICQFCFDLGFVFENSQMRDCSCGMQASLQN